MARGAPRVDATPGRSRRSAASSRSPTPRLPACGWPRRHSDHAPAAPGRNRHGRAGARVPPGALARRGRAAGTRPEGLPRIRRRAALLPGPQSGLPRGEDRAGDDRPQLRGRARPGRRAGDRAARLHDEPQGIAGSVCARPPQPAISHAIREVAGAGQRLPDRRGRAASLGADRGCGSSGSATRTSGSGRTGSCCSRAARTRTSSPSCGSSTPTAPRPSCRATARARRSSTCAATAGPTRTPSRSAPRPGRSCRRSPRS